MCAIYILMGAKQRIVNDYIGDLKGDYCKVGSFHYNLKKNSIRNIIAQISLVFNPLKTKNSKT
jgi:hypothetical protein